MSRDDSKSDEKNPTLAETGEFDNPTRPDNNAPAFGDSAAPSTGDSQAASQNDATIDFSNDSSDRSVTSTDSSGAIAAKQNGSQFGPYILQEEIARGGMGVVYRAQHEGLNRPVALKMILAGNLASDEDVRRFYTEAEAAAKLDHPNIVPVFDVGECEGTHYFAMKLIEGGDLGSRLRELRNDLSAAVEVLEKVCRAVGHAHQRGILHRDLKPANILLDESDEPFVVDLGLARRVGAESDLTRTGAVVGTPSYMSPEQASGEADLTTATDVYSLGALLYEILSGQPPFRGKSPMETLLQVINDSPIRPSVSAATDRTLEMIALKCLEKTPGDRYPTALALAEDLRRWRNGEPVTIKGASLGSITKGWLRQNFGNAAWILVVGALGGLLAGVGVWTATVQREVNNGYEYVYGFLENHQPPFAFYNVPTPSWIQLPSLMLFVGAISLLGFFTALLVRTKNTSADVAAGLMVGCIAAAGAFFFAFATMGANVVIKTEDSNFLAMLAVAAENDTPVPIVDEYPELEELEREEQVRLLQSKIQLDRSALLSRGLLLASLACFGLFVLSGVAETMVAGAALRRHASIWRALGEYILRATPYIAVSVFVGIHSAVLLIFGRSGLVMDWWSAITIVGLLIGVLSEYCRWPIWIRLTTLTISAVVLANFFVNEFGLMPRLATARYDLKMSLAKAERFPDRESMQSKAANSSLMLGVALYNADRLGAAEVEFRRAIQFMKRLPVGMRGTRLDSIDSVAHSNLAYALRNQGNAAQADQFLLSAVADQVDNEYLGASAVKFFSRTENEQLADGLIDSQVIDQPKALRALRRMAYARKSYDLEADEDDAAAMEQAVDLLRERMRMAPAALHSRLLELPVQQAWQLLRPAERKRLDDLERFVIERWRPKNVGDKATQLDWLQDGFSIAADFALDQAAVKPFEPLQFDLTRVFPAAGINTAVFAIAIVKSEQAREVTLHLGSDDGFRLWLNGTQLAAYEKSRSFQSRQDSIPTTLQAGPNFLVLRVNQSSGPWAFALHIDETDGWPARIQWLEPADWNSSLADASSKRAIVEPSQ